MHMTISIVVMHVTVFVVAMYVTVSSSNFIFVSLTATHFSKTNKNCLDCLERALLFFYTFTSIQKEKLHSREQNLYAWQTSVSFQKNIKYRQTKKQEPKKGKETKEENILSPEY